MGIIPCIIIGSWHRPLHSYCISLVTREAFTDDYQLFKGSHETTFNLLLDA